MRLMRPVIQNLQRRAHWAFFACLLIAVFFDSHTALADVNGAARDQAFGGYVATTVEKTNVLVDIMSYIAYFMGAVFVALGISELRRVVDGSGGSSLSLRHPLTKLGFGGMFLGLPFFTHILQNTMTGDGTFDFTKLNTYRFGPLLINEQGLSGLISNGVLNMGALVSFAAFVAYVIGVFFTMRGIQLLKNHIDNPGSTPLPESLKRLGVGGALFSMPMLTHMVKNTLGLDHGTVGMLANTGFAAQRTTDGGLDNMMLNLVSEVANPAYFAIEAFCYIAGVLLILFGMQRLVRTAQDGPRGPLTFGTIAMFFVAGALLSFPQLLSLLNNSLTGHGEALTQVSFMSIAGADEMQVQNAKNVFSAVLAFMAVVGFLSVVRGLFMLKTFAEGGQATMMQVAVHLVAGAIAINLGMFINAIQTSLGVTNFAVTFS